MVKIQKYFKDLLVSFSSFEMSYSLELVRRANYLSSTGVPVTPAWSDATSGGLGVIAVVTVS